VKTAGQLPQRQRTKNDTDLPGAGSQQIDNLSPILTVMGIGRQLCRPWSIK